MKVGKITHRIDGEEVTEEEFNRKSRAKRAKGGPAVSRAYEQPLESIAASVHPEQVSEYRQFLQQRGIQGVEVRENGRVLFHSREARRRLLESTGRRDNDGGYGDG